MFGIKRKYERKSNVKRGRKAFEWKSVDLDPDKPVLFAGERSGFVWFHDAQKPFSEWQMLDDDTVNVKLHVIIKKNDYGVKFVNLLQSDITVMPN